MAYRVKVYKEMETELLKPVMDFIGLTFDTSKEHFRQYRWIDLDRDEKNRPIVQHLRNKFKDDKIFINVGSYEEYVNFRNNREEYDYFNPFIKDRNTLHLLLLMSPVIYERFCNDEDSDDLDDLVDLIVNNETAVTQEEIFKHVNIKQHPLRKSKDSMENIHKFSVEILRKSGEEFTLIAEANSKITAMWILMLKIMDLLDDTPDIVYSHDGIFDDVKVTISDMFERYSKERELNNKDLRKVKKDDNTTDEIIDLITDNYDKMMDPDINQDDQLVEEEKTISLTDDYKIVPIQTNKDDDDNLFNSKYDLGLF